MGGAMKIIRGHWDDTLDKRCCSVLVGAFHICILVLDYTRRLGSFPVESHQHNAGTKSKFFCLVMRWSRKSAQDVFVQYKHHNIFLGNTLHQYHAWHGITL